MPHPTTSAERRHHQRRFDNRAKRISSQHGHPEGWVHRRHNRQVCSCAGGCGNPRHDPYGTLRDRLTMQERRHNDIAQEMEADLAERRGPLPSEQLQWGDYLAAHELYMESLAD